MNGQEAKYEMIAKIENLQKQYQGLKVIEDLSFTLKRGEIVCLLGPSGAGKTTLLNIMAGLAAPDEGVCQITDRISYVFQEDRLLPWKNVLENVMFSSTRQDTDKAKGILEKLGLIDFCNYYPAQLSGGMRQRVAIARAFYAEGNLLLMDEPFQSLDIELRLRLLKELVGLWEVRRNTIFFVTHSLEEAVLIGHRIWIMTGAPTKIKKEFKVSKAPSERMLVEFKELKKEIENELMRVK